MITKLTKEQEDQIPLHLEKWLAVGRRTETIDRDKATNAVNFLYEKIMQVKKPKQVLFLDSPIACQIFMNSQLDSQLGSQLRSQLDSQLYSQLGSQLRSQLRSQLDSQLDSQLGSQLYSQLGSQLGSQLDSQLGSQRIYESITNWGQSYYWYYEFILNNLLPELVPNFKIYTEYLEHSKELHHSYFFPEIAVLSDFPSVINLDKEGRLDNLQGKALEYRDGYGIFASHGKRVETLLEAVLL